MALSEPGTVERTLSKPANDVNVVYSVDSETDELEEELEAESEAGDVNVEVKKNFHLEEEKVTSQVVSMAVMMSFTNQCLFYEYISPVLLLCKKRVRVCFFDCHNAILLFSEDVELAE